jgi:hypothetical protein
MGQWEKCQQIAGISNTVFHFFQINTINVVLWLFSVLSCPVLRAHVPVCGNACPKHKRSFSKRGRVGGNPEMVCPEIGDTVGHLKTASLIQQIMMNHQNL